MIPHLRGLFVLLAVMAIIPGGCSGDRDSRKVVARVVLPDSSGISVFELLDAFHEVEYRETSSGVFVTGIDSVAGSKNSYWLYLVNDSAGTVASDKYILRRGERVEWRLVSGY